MGYSNLTGGNNNNQNPPVPPNPFIPTGMPQAPDPTLIDPTELLINYNDRFKNSGTILFRDNVIRQTLSAIIGKNKPNALLVGPAGVGKTKILEDIACRLANDDPLIPDKIKGYTIYELPLSNIVAGSSLVGQMEEKVKAVVEFCEEPKNKVILFIDEIHQLVGESASGVYQKIAQILKPALARGDMRVIGATTTQESKWLSDDPAFNRRFTQLIVDELTSEQTLELLNNSVGDFIQHHNNRVIINKDTLQTVVTLADEYKKAGNHRPDTALTLLDRSLGDAVVDRKVKEIAARNTGNQVVLQALQSQPITLTEKQIRTTAIRIATGNAKPADFDETDLRDALSVIKGQDHIIDDVIQAVKEHNAPYYRFDGSSEGKNKPDVFLFVGPSGVGKTEVTKILAKYTTGTEPIILNMTEYNSSASINRIIGAPAGYVGYDSNAELPFDILETNPYQVILLDEFEKCNPAVQTLFMQAFDEGYIKTSKGAIIDFSKSIIIATSNAANQTMHKSLGFNAKKDVSASVSDLSKFFDVALLNRFTKILQFNFIDKETYREIVRNTYKRDVARILARYPRTQLPLDLDDDVLDKLVEESYEENFGARPAAKTVKHYVLEQVL